MANIRTDSNLLSDEGIRAVDLGDGVRVPERVTIHYSDDPGIPYDVELEVVVRDGRFVCESVTCRSREEPVTTEGLRQVPVASILRRGLTGHVYQPLPDDPQRFEQFTPDSDVAQHGPTSEALRAAATIYRLAYALGDAPTKSVAEALELTYSTAARWVAKAREGGFLGETTQGRAGGVEVDETKG